MKGWLVVNGFLHSEKFDQLTELFVRASKKYEIHLSVKKNSEIPIALERQWESFPEFVIFWDKDIPLAKMLERKGIRLFNSSQAIYNCDDKRETYFALEKGHIPIPKTMIAPMTYQGIGYTSYEFLGSMEHYLGYPLIVKEAFGSFGEQVFMAKNRRGLVELLSSCHTSDILFQEYVANSHGRDIRLQVVGEEVVAAMYRYSETDFRANVSAGGKMKAYIPSEEEVSLAIQACKAVGADFAGVDLLFGLDGPCVCEVNSNAHFKNLLDCTGVNTAEKILEYIVSLQNSRGL